MYYHTWLGSEGSVVVIVICMPGLGVLWAYSNIFVSFCGITGCGSASLKLCVCNVASPWSQSPSPDSQCGVQPTAKNVCDLLSPKMAKIAKR